MPLYIQAGLWGLLGGSALVLGAVIAYAGDVRHSVGEKHPLLEVERAFFSYPRELAEAALAHVVGDETERVYRRGDALEKRRAMMDAWAAYVSTGEAVSVAA